MGRIIASRTKRLHDLLTQTKETLIDLEAVIEYLAQPSIDRTDRDEATKEWAEQMSVLAETVAVLKEQTERYIPVLKVIASADEKQKASPAKNAKSASNQTAQASASS